MLIEKEDWPLRHQPPYVLSVKIDSTKEKDLIRCICEVNALKRDEAFKIVKSSNDKITLLSGTFEYMEFKKSQAERLFNLEFLLEPLI
jgi:hypothetical protein